MILFDTQEEGRFGPGMEETVVVKRPLWHVRGSLSSPLSRSLQGSPGFRGPTGPVVFAGPRRIRETLAPW